MRGRRRRAEAATRKSCCAEMRIAGRNLVYNCTRRRLKSSSDLSQDIWYLFRAVVLCCWGFVWPAKLNAEKVERNSKHGQA